MSEYRALLILLCNALVIYLIAMANSALAWTGIYVYTGGLFVIYAAMHCRLRNGALVALVSALLFDATHAMPFGLSLALFGFAFILAWYWAGQIDPASGIAFGTLAAMLNLPMFLALAIALGAGELTQSAYWGRIGLDLLAATIVTFILGIWFRSFQRSLLLLCGAVTLDELEKT